MYAEPPASAECINDDVKVRERLRSERIRSKRQDK